MKRVWHGVRSITYDSGQREMMLIYDVREEKPSECYQRQMFGKLYDYWFDSLDDAIRFLKEGQKDGFRLTNISLEEL